MGHPTLTELDVVALLFAAPTDLNQLCTSCPPAELQAKLEEELRKLGVSDEARATAVPRIARLTKDELTTFQSAATTLHKMFWDGEGPHPSPVVARDMIAKARGVVPA